MLRWITLALTLPLLFHFALAALGHPSEEPPFNCESLLNALGPEHRDRLRVIFAMGQFETHFSENAAILRAHDSRGSRRVDLSSSASPIWRSEHWIHQGQDYEFLDVGFKNLETDSNRLNHLLLNHVLNEPNTDLNIFYGPRRSADLSELKYYRWFLHEAVMAKYRQEKLYLTSVDFGQLNWTNITSGNNDVIAVLKGKTVIVATAEELSKRIGATLQISYFGDRNFFQPSLDGVLRASGIEPIRKKDRFPFEHRLRPDAAAEFREEFDINFLKEKVCEFTRYAKFAQLPPPVQDRMLFEALNMVLKRGMRTIVVSADQISERLFRRYGFKRWKQLPTAQQQMAEYLLYLDVRSQLFKDFFNKMKLSASEVQVVSDGVKSEKEP